MVRCRRRSISPRCLTRTRAVGVCSSPSRRSCQIQVQYRVPVGAAVCLQSILSRILRCLRILLTRQVLILRQYELYNPKLHLPPPPIIRNHSNLRSRTRPRFQTQYRKHLRKLCSLARISTRKGRKKATSSFYRGKFQVIRQSLSRIINFCRPIQVV